MTAHKQRIVTSIAVVTCVISLVVAIAITFQSASQPKQKASGTPVAQPTALEKAAPTRGKELASRLRKLVNVKSLDISGTDSFIVNVVIQSSTPNSQYINVAAGWDRALVDRELQLSYRIDSPASTYSVTQVAVDGTEPFPFWWTTS